MRLLFDTNVWVSALVARGICAQLVREALERHGAQGHELLTCPRVRREARRVIAFKLKATTAQLALLEDLWASVTEVRDGPKAGMPPGFPDPDDWPIVAAALAAGADGLVTGDKALLALGSVEGMPMVDPRTAYLRLRGIG